MGEVSIPSEAVNGRNCLLPVSEHANLQRQMATIAALNTLNECALPYK